MSLSIGAVVAQFDANIKGFEQGVQKAEAQMSGFQKTVDKSGNKIMGVFNAIGGAVLGASKAAGIAGAAFATFGIKTAADLQALSSSFETLTGSAETGRKVFQDLVKMGKFTPFEVGDLAKATQTMLGYGISVEETQKSLNMLGDISLGNRDKLQSLALAFAQVKGNGRLMGQEVLQMVNAGFNPLQIISEKTGKSMSVLRDEMADGKISFEMVADAMKTATSEGGLFYKGMEKGATTINGTFSTLIDNFKLMSAGMVGLKDDGTILEGSLLDLVQRGVNYLNEQLGKIDWVKVGQDISNNLKKAIEDTQTAIENIIDWYEKHKIAIEIAVVAVGSFVTALTIVKTAVWAYTAAIALATVATTGFKAAIGFITGPIGIAVIIIASLIGLLYSLWRNWGALTAEGTFLGNKIQWVKDKFDDLKEAIKGMMMALGNIRMPKALTDIGDKIKGLGNIPGLGKLFGRDTVPGFADGVRNFGGGLAIVGERGPELVNLPKGSDVFSNTESKSMMGGSGVTIENMNIKSNVDWEYGVQLMAQKLRLS